MRLKLSFMKLEQYDMNCERRAIVFIRCFRQIRCFRCEAMRQNLNLKLTSASAVSALRVTHRLRQFDDPLRFA